MLTSRLAKPGGVLKVRPQGRSVLTSFNGCNLAFVG
jgi:hypothetical protein